MKQKRTRKFKWTPYLYVAPFFIGYTLFSLYPTLYAFWLSFFEWDGIGDKLFIGITNYADAVHNEFFLHSLLVSAEYVLTGPITTFFALLMAFVLNSRLIVRPGIYKMSYFIPYITMPIAVGILFKMLLGWEYGIINKLLSMLGLIEANINWLGESKYVFFCIALVVVWKYFGYHMIIYLGGLQSVDTTLYEAAKIDGANSAQIFMRITVPLLKPYIVLLLLNSINGGMNLFDEPMMLYGASGGPNGAAQNSGMFNYFTTFVSNRWGFGSAVSVITFVIVCVLSIIFYKINYHAGMEGD
ncbi:MAG: carbohydrate ABC transporter permease [Massiliimalia sp.]|jgi:cellobiose transport system permease protein